MLFYSLAAILMGNVSNEGNVIENYEIKIFRKKAF